MKRTMQLLLLGVAAFVANASASTNPIANQSLCFEEQDGLVAVEAEHFHRQTHTDQRAWHVTASGTQPEGIADGDPAHLAGASGGAYLECLPDTRRTHDDRLIRGENFSPEPGQMAVLHYRVHFNNPGRYYVWVRAFSTGTEDNGIHVGLNGAWPASGQRLQWCEGKNTWRWESKQRTEENHCGEPHKIYLDVEKSGEHELMFSMREDGFEFDKFLLTRDREFARPTEAGPAPLVKSGQLPAAFAAVADSGGNNSAQRASGQPDGNGGITVTGEQKQWHKITLTMNGPYAHEGDMDPNPFTDYAFVVRFSHQSGSPNYNVPGYFAADGNAGQTGAESGTQWRAHFAPDRTGTWNYAISFKRGRDAALDGGGTSVAGFDGKSGRFEVAASDKQGRDFRAWGRLQYVGKHHLQFAGSKEYFLKAGPDAPETLMAYADFDNTRAGKPENAPLKTWEPHVRDWNEGDPTWKDGKGKGLIGALNYLAEQGLNAFSFLPYNAGGDGDNVWPFVGRDDKLHYDCSKLDQWGVVFDHATATGLYLHFKMQETEIDDDRHGRESRPGLVPTSLDGGKLGRERKLYCRELIARFGHGLALNWNLGEENTQSPEEQRDMAQYIRDVDPYDHHIVVHTYPNEQDKVYPPLLGEGSVLTGASLQNDWKATHRRTVQWVRASAEAGKPWVVANDEQGSADTGVPPDMGYQGFDGKNSDGKTVPTTADIRQHTLWGNLLGGGAGVEYYFGYKLPENDLVCEDFRSRAESWKYCRIALEFFSRQDIPFWEMSNADALVGAKVEGDSKYCLAKMDEIYLVYLADGGTSELDLAETSGSFTVRWFNPRAGGGLQGGSVESVRGGGKVSLGHAPQEREEDWLVVIRKSR